MSSLPPPPPYFMTDVPQHQPHLIDTSSYFNCYHHPIAYNTTPSAPSPSSSTPSSVLTSSHFASGVPASSSGAPPYKLDPSSSHIITPPSGIPTPSPSSTFGFPMSDYSVEQMEAICTSLYQAREGSRLVAFFNQFDSAYGPERWGSESIVVAYAYSLYHSNQFEAVFQLLSTRSFHPDHFNELQTIWNNARYKESELKRGKELNPVEKYRLRRKFPPPKTIWDGEDTIYSFKDSSRKYLKNFYRHETSYPSQEQKREISRATGLSAQQISNWFKNRRQRNKQSASAKASPPSSSSSTTGGNDFAPVILPHNFNVNMTGFTMNNMFF